jgi:hypothetical protein
MDDTNKHISSHIDFYAYCSTCIKIVVKKCDICKFNLLFSNNWSSDTLCNECKENLGLNISRESDISKENSSESYDLMSQEDKSSYED